MRPSSVLAASLVLGLATPAQAALIYSRTITTTTGEVVFFDTDTRTVLRTYAFRSGTWTVSPKTRRAGTCSSAPATGRGCSG